MEIIKRWLSGSQNFIVGRTYYRRFGADNKLQQLFDKGETPFACNELKKALESLANGTDNTTAAPGKKTAAAQQKTPTKLIASVMPKGGDTVTAAIEKEWRPMYQRMNYLRHELDKYGTDNSDRTREACRLICAEILDLEQKCMQCWEKRDYYAKHGKLPEVKDEKLEIPEDPVKAGRMIETLKRNIRRNKSLAEKFPDKPLYAAKVKEYEEKLVMVLNKKTNQ